jgi:hypothetical protein
MPYKPQVIADDTGEWVGNGLVFATEAEADAYVKDLASRWVLVRNTRIVEVDEKPNYTIKDGVLKHIDG